MLFNCRKAPCIESDLYMIIMDAPLSAGFITVFLLEERDLGASLCVGERFVDLVLV